MGDIMRKKWIDDLRGWIIILMIIGHIIGGLVQFDGENNVFRTILYQFHMPVLFVISGFISREYVLCESKFIDYLKFFFKNLIGLYIPYLLWGGMFWCVKYFVFQGNEPVTVQDLLTLPYSLNAWYPGWFLLALLGIKCIDELLDELNSDLVIRIIFWALLLGISFFVRFPQIIMNIMEFGIYYIWGKLLKKYSCVWDGKTVLWCFSILMIIIGSLVFVKGNIRLSKLINSIGASWLLFYIFSRYSKGRNKITVQIGQYSMIPYVLHAYFIIPFKIVLMRFNCQSLILYVVIETFASVIFSLCIIHVVKRNSLLLSLFYPKLKRKVFQNNL